MTLSDSSHTSQSELLTQSYESSAPSESSVASKTSTYTNYGSSTSATPRKRSFDTAFPELEPAHIWASEWPASDFILPSMEPDVWAKDLCKNLDAIDLGKSFTGASIRGGPSVVQADQLSTTDAPQNSSDQPDAPEGLQTKTPTANMSQKATNLVHPIVSQAIAWGTKRTSQWDILELSEHLDSCSCWRGLECHFTREQRYFPQWNEDEGDKKLMIMEDGRPCITVATVWMPTHLLSPTKRNIEYEKSFRKAPRSTVLAIYDMLLDRLEFYHSQVETGKESFREMSLAESRAVEFPRGYHFHLAWQRHVRAQIERMNIFECGCSKASVSATSILEPRTPKRSMKVLVTLVQAVMLKQQAMRYILGVKANQRSIERLAIMCEELLSNTCWQAPAALPTIPAQKLRWSKEERGWTGLKPEDIDL
ncbi:hypothetical protein N7G274_010050 [Stereocaulon virgatum]|uniref:Uncharacterized protein n=1 Tax=Stereocaulon virgatum TaxID=373712 RepID=A0ABR3ZYN6_9LECA